ncbi:MAG: hypothetical protein IID36_01520 [Planctomycetes bacterium]|nr:hypothetical protein [Planctomycetota bacterium]
MSQPVLIRGKDVAKGTRIEGIPSFTDVCDAVVRESVRALLNPTAVASDSVQTAVARWCAKPPEVVYWEQGVKTNQFFQQLPGQIVIGADYAGLPVLVKRKEEMVEIGTAPISVPVDVQFTWGRSIFQKFDVGYFTKVFGSSAGVQKITPGEPVAVLPGFSVVVAENELVHKTAAAVYTGSLIVEAWVRKENGSLVEVTGRVSAADFLKTFRVRID